jgi:hypothetical protein
MCPSVATSRGQDSLDPLVPSAATIRFLDQAIEHIARTYLTAMPARLTEEVRLYLAWAERLLANSRTPAQHQQLSVQLGYLNGILAQLLLTRGDHAATQAYCEAAMRAADEADGGQLRAWILSIQAMLAAYTNRQKDVIDLTNAGLEAADQVANAVAVKLASLQARAHANLGNQPAAEAALARARQAMAQVPPAEQDARRATRATCSGHERYVAINHGHLLQARQGGHLSLTWRVGVGDCDRAT